MTVKVCNKGKFLRPDNHTRARGVKKLLTPFLPFCFDTYIASSACASSLPELTYPQASIGWLLSYCVPGIDTAIRSLAQHKAIADSKCEMLFMFKAIDYGFLDSPCTQNFS